MINKKIKEDEIPNKLLNNENLNSHINDLENYIRDLKNFLPIALCSIDLESKIIDINTSLLSITGYSNNEIVGNKIDMLFKNEEDFKSIISETKNKGYIKYNETNLVTKDNSEIPIAVTTGSRKDAKDRTIGYFVAIINTSEFKKEEETLKEKITCLEEDEIAMLELMKELHETRGKLKKFNENLEELVKERTAEVEKLLQQKDEFIKQLGHDLKSPLTPLIGLLPILEKHEVDPKLVEILGIFRRNIEYMRNIVLQTLELAKLNAPSTVFDIKDIKLWNEAENCIKDQQTVYHEKGIIIDNKIDENIFVEADQEKLSEVFHKLIINAVKYSPKNSKITLDAFSESDFVTITISDTGFGMTNIQIDHIFDEFYKGDKSRHELFSSGLGLSICKKIVEKHGGKIWAESPGPEKGSTFYFTLKRSKSKNKIKSKKTDSTKTLKIPSNSISDDKIVREYLNKLDSKRSSSK
ncbi:hypothetical protein AYK20_04695 [Thermoplasmatales archaeon SG8-52-1]|nr:MAG: hypothetical protein AYK20_04695 [Thermoplasmatales archaeon SG8-52-1]